MAAQFPAPVGWRAASRPANPQSGGGFDKFNFGKFGDNDEFSLFEAYFGTISFVGGRARSPGTSLDGGRVPRRGMRVGAPVHQ
eukprot:14997884-Heterocapsa_arctica.AAC.1